MARASVSMRVGNGGKKKTELAGDAAAMGRTVAEMREELEQIKEENKQNKDQIGRLEEENRRNEETIEELRRELKK